MNINNCPLCGIEKLEKQSEGSLHAFTINYECGSKIIYSHDGPYLLEINKRCDEVETFSEALISNCETNILEIEKNCGRNKMSDVKISPVCDTVETFSEGLIKHAERVREAAFNLESNTNRLNNSYFSTSFDKSESVEKEADNVNDKIHKLLNDIQESIGRATEFVTQL